MMPSLQRQLKSKKRVMMYRDDLEHVFVSLMQYIGTPHGGPMPDEGDMWTSITAAIGTLTPRITTHDSDMLDVLTDAFVWPMSSGTGQRFAPIDDFFS